MDFDGYIRQVEPHKRAKGYAWKTAIGLQAVDGLKPSSYLLETARRDIEGEITIDEADHLLRSYYESKELRTPEEEGEHEADRASLNIRRILAEDTFSFNFIGLTSIHRRIFEEIYDFAGEIRDYNITKKEWVLKGDTVRYVPACDLKMSIEYDLEQERKFNYTGLDRNALVQHICKFVSGLWQIHPFGEGNTRTTAVFIIKYLRSMGFSVDNDLFAENSWYFRNALVRANYQNLQKGIMYDYSFLEKFFRNLLFGESNDLKNRYLLIEASDIFNTPTSTPTSIPTSTPTSISDDRMLENDNIIRLVKVLSDKQLSLKAILVAIGLKDRENIMEYSLRPAIQNGLVTMLYPQSPRHPRQKYLLTPKGLLFLKDLEKVME